MADQPRYRILPEELPDPPAFSAKVQHWGCLLGFAAFIVGFIISQLIGTEPAGSIIMLVLVSGAVIFSSVQYAEAKRRQIQAQRSEWMCQQISERESKAHDLTLRASGLLNRFQGSLSSFPELLSAADMYLDAAQTEFLERAYAPFWDNIEGAAMSLGSFHARLKQMEADARSYYGLLQGRVHDFPVLSVKSDEIPSPAQQANRLRELVRMGQRDFEFATMWEHRKTQKILLEGFRTLGEAVNNIGVAVEDAASRVTKTIKESSDKILEEHRQLRVSVEDAVRKWEEQKHSL